MCDFVTYGECSQMVRVLELWSHEADLSLTMVDLLRRWFLDNIILGRQSQCVRNAWKPYHNLPQSMDEMLKDIFFCKVHSDGILVSESDKVHPLMNLCKILSEAQYKFLLSVGTYLGSNNL